MNLKDARKIASRWREADDLWDGTTDPNLSESSVALIVVDNRVIELEAENEELTALFDLQQTRLKQATELWRKATGQPNVIPDLGVLLTWLLKGQDLIKLLIRIRAELLPYKQHPTVDKTGPIEWIISMCDREIKEAGYEKPNNI